MASFQPANQVRIQQTTFFTGNIVKDGPIRSNSLTLNTQTPLDPANNIVGRAFTFVPLIDEQAQAGLNAATDVFAGILVGANQEPLKGTTADPLAPSLLVPNGAVGDFVYMGILSVVLTPNPNNATGLANVGDRVIFNNATGELSALAVGVALPAGYTLILNSQVTRFNKTATTPVPEAEITLLGGNVNT